MANFGPLLRFSLTHLMLITAFLHILPEGHWEPHSVVASLCLVKRLVRFKPGTFRFWLQHLYFIVFLGIFIYRSVFFSTLTFWLSRVSGRNLFHYNILTMDLFLLQGHIQTVWETGVLVWAPKLWHPKSTVRLSIHLSVCLAPYFMNHTSSNYNFWYTCVRWRYLHAFFKFFWNFHFLGCYRDFSFLGKLGW